MIAVLWVSRDGENRIVTLQQFMSAASKMSRIPAGGGEGRIGLSAGQAVAFKRATIPIAGRSCDPAAFDGEAPIRDFVQRQARNSNRH